MSNKSNHKILKTPVTKRESRANDKHKSKAVQYLYKMRIKGTALKGIFNFQKTILSSGITKWHLTEKNIQCSEINTEGRILFNYNIEGKNLLEYYYNFPTDFHTIVFEIHELVHPLSIMKISDVLSIHITSSDTNIIHIHVIDKDGNTTRKKIYTQIVPDIVISRAPDIYSKMPVNIEPEVFHTFLRTAITNKDSEFIKIDIQSPNYLAISTNNRETQTHGKIKGKSPTYSQKFYINEIKYITKLLQSTHILNIYQPISNIDLAPLCICGSIKLVGEFQIYIHNSSVSVSDE